MGFGISHLIALTVLILKFYAIKAIPSPAAPPRSTTNSCNCIRAEDCTTYTELLKPTPFSGACGITYDSKPMICCPTQHDLNERWVWDKRPKTTKDIQASFDIQNKFLNEPSHRMNNDFIHTNLIDDYYNWKTQRNCPPILYREKLHNFHGHFGKSSSSPHKNYYDDFDYTRPQHKHHHGFKHHHHQHQQHNFYDDDDEDGGDEDDTSVDEHDIIHRGQFHRPRIVWPDTKHSATNDGGQHFRSNTPTTTTTTTTAIPIPTTPLSRPKKITINSPNCGVTLNKRIIGGIEALPGEFPWITRIAYLNQSDNSIAYRCSGSFITEFHIITAAHCVTNLDNTLTLSHIRLVDLDTSNTQTNPTTYEIAETIVHPNYDTPRRSNDIALLRINKPNYAIANYGTICLPKLTNFGNTNTQGTQGIVAGWSNNEGTSESDFRVRYLRLPIMNNTECASRYEQFRQGFTEKITIDSGMLCTLGQANGSDVCRGDSGGPLMDAGDTSIFNNEGRYTLLGIVAFGPICGFTNLLPGVYMRVSEYVNWITNSIS